MGFPLHLGTLVLMLIFYRQVQPMDIYGGKEAVPHSRPYMVLVNRTSGAKMCDGFLVREDFVMTAAHCNDKNIKVALGVHNVFNKTGEEILVKKTFPHPNFNTTTMDNDIMLLKLEKKASLNSMVRLIDLPQTNDEKVPKNCLVSGWGMYKDNDTGSPMLREVNITTKDDKLCSDHHVICSSGSKGPAQGDSGGPLVCNDVAYGVVSYRVHHNNDNTYIYVCIPHFLDWITDTMKA
ncbi:granzyme B [Esox lucius]|nr:granzyme B [Esox lucius]